MQFVTASHNEKVLQDNLLSSSLFEYSEPQIMRGYNNIPLAYNSAILKDEPVCYLHNDIFLPDTFIKDIEESMKLLPDDWEVCGIAGVTLNPGKQIHGYILDRGKVWGRPIDTPVKVDTIDELLIITRKPVKFDEQFEQDFYAADICIGRNVYVISGFCHHNSSREFGGRTSSFFESENKFRIKHADRLPIATTCSLIEANV